MRQHLKLRSLFARSHRPGGAISSPTECCVTDQVVFGHAGTVRKGQEVKVIVDLAGCGHPDTGPGFTGSFTRKAAARVLDTREVRAAQGEGRRVAITTNEVNAESDPGYQCDPGRARHTGRGGVIRRVA